MDFLDERSAEHLIATTTCSNVAQQLVCFSEHKRALASLVGDLLDDLHQRGFEHRGIQNNKVRHVVDESLMLSWKKEPHLRVLAMEDHVVEFCTMQSRPEAKGNGDDALHVDDADLSLLHIELPLKASHSKHGEEHVNRSDVFLMLLE